MYQSYNFTCFNLSTDKIKYTNTNLLIMDWYTKVQCIVGQALASFRPDPQRRIQKMDRGMKYY